MHGDRPLCNLILVCYVICCIEWDKEASSFLPSLNPGYVDPHLLGLPHLCSVGTGDCFQEVLFSMPVTNPLSLWNLSLAAHNLGGW